MIKNKECKVFLRIPRILIFMMCFVLFEGCQNSKSSSETGVSSLESTNTSLVQSESAEILDKDTLLIVTGEYAPYTTQAEENRGFLTEIVEATLKYSGLKYKIEFYPWARCSEMVLSGEAWATFPYGYSEEKELSYEYSYPIFSSKHKFFYLKGNEKIGTEVSKFSKISDFSNLYTFGGANDYWYGNQAKFEEYGVKVEWANDTDALVKMLHSGRIDFFIEDELVCGEAIERLFPNEIDTYAKLPIEAKIQEYFLISSKDYPKTKELTDQFNSALLILTENGEINKILEDNGIEY